MAPSILSSDLRQIIHRADKDVRRKNYVCLFPNCNRRAIDSHAIPRASLIEALAEQGHVYSRRPNLTELLHTNHLFDPVEVVRLGVNQASTFKGFCARHDALLFSPIEQDNDRKKHLVHALFLRSLALEYCRHRQTTDYLSRVCELGPSPPFMIEVEKHLTLMSAIMKLKRFAVDYIMTPKHESVNEGTDYFIVPIARNLKVSCCGCFDGVTDGSGYVPIGYNILSYKDASILALTTYRTTGFALDRYIEGFGPVHKFDLEGMLNDVTFSKGEEPVMSPSIWSSLSDDSKQAIGLSLRHPSFRESLVAPQIIKLSKEDVSTEISPSLWTRIFSSLVSNQSKLTYQRRTLSRG
jgi:hypothetical protein